MRNLIFGAALAISSLFGLSAHAEPVAGQQYVELKSPVPISKPGKVEVVELFWYGCPHCYQFESTLNPWVEELPEDVAEPLDIERLALTERLAQRAALDELRHQEEGLSLQQPEVVELNHVCVVQACDGLRFAKESPLGALELFRGLARDDLDGDVPFHATLVRSIDHSHATRSDDTAHVVAVIEPASGQQRGIRNLQQAAAVFRAHQELCWMGGVAHGANTTNADTFDACALPVCTPSSVSHHHLESGPIRE